jgi:RecA/RadA recombinase
MSLMERLKKTSTIKETAVLSESKIVNGGDVCITDVPALNIALSGSLYGGISSGLILACGKSKSFKTSLCLVMAKAYLDKHDDAVLIFMDTEYGSPKSYFESFEIDIERVLHVPIMDIEEFKFEVMAQLNALDRKTNVIFVVDSIGNMSSRKEREDSLAEKSVSDLTRAKQLKSCFRMITPYLTKYDIPMICVNHTYDSMSLFPSAVVSGGCLEAGTNLIMFDGSIKKIEDIEVGELVKTLNGSKPVTHIWNPDTLEVGEPECFEIEFEDGYKCVVSENHPFLTDSGWVEASNLSTDKTLVCIDNQRNSKIKSIISVGTRKVYDISVKDVEHYILENGVVTHNTGIYYSANTIFIIGRQQEKDGTDVIGYNFIINVEKSRFVKEKSKIPICVNYDNGISKWSGLMDMALEAGICIKPKNGWYQRIDTKTGEIEDKNYRLKETNTKEFWNPILQSDKFKQWVEDRYKIANGTMLTDDSITDELDNLDMDDLDD